MRPSDHFGNHDDDHNDDHNNRPNNNYGHPHGQLSSKYSKLLAIDNMLAHAICDKANLINPVFPENITIDDNLYFSSGKSHEIAVLYDAANNQNAKLSLYAESFCFFPNSYIDTTVISPFQISFEDNSDPNNIFPINGIISNYNTQYSWYNYNSISASSELYMNISENGNISSKGTLFIAPIVDPEDPNYASQCKYFNVDPGAFNVEDGSVVVSNMPFSVIPCSGGTELLKADPYTGTVRIEGDGLFVNDSNFSVTTTNVLANVPATFSNPNDTDSFTIDTLTNKKVSTNNLPLEINGPYARLHTNDLTYPSNDADLLRKIDVARLVQGFKPKGTADIMTDMSEWTPTIMQINSTGSPGSISFVSDTDITDTNNSVQDGVLLEEGSIVLLNNIPSIYNPTFSGIYSWEVTAQPDDTNADGTYTGVIASGGSADTNDSNDIAVADIVVTDGIVTSFVLTNVGDGYLAGDVVTFDVDGLGHDFVITLTQDLQAACGLYVVSAGTFDSSTGEYQYTWERRSNMENGSNAVGATVFVTEGTHKNTLFIQIIDQYQSGEGNPPVPNTTTYVGQHQLKFEPQASIILSGGPGIDITGQTISVDIAQSDTSIYNNLIFSSDPITNASYLTIRDDPIFTPTGVTAPITTSITTSGINLSGGTIGESGPAIYFNSNGNNDTAGQVTGLYFGRNDDEASTIIQTYYNGENSSDLQFWVTQKTNDTNDTNWSTDNPYLAMTIQPTDTANAAVIGINNTNPAHALDVVGNVRGSAIIATSDLRLKENIKPLENSLDKILAMQGVSYNLIDDENKVTQVGVVAQEIEKVLPEVVVTDADDMKSVAYGNITAVLIEAVKELQQQVNDLKATVEELKK
jgi:hypothetical protein